jgi:hypothetical protein
VLEILTVVAYYSDLAATQVISGMRVLARANNEAPFAMLAVALQQQDLEVKAAIMQVTQLRNIIYGTAFCVFVFICMLFFFCYVQKHNIYSNRETLIELCFCFFNCFCLFFSLHFFLRMLF